MTTRRSTPLGLMIRLAAGMLALTLGSPTQGEILDPVADATELHKPDSIEPQGCLYPPAHELAQLATKFASIPREIDGTIHRIVNRFHVIRRADGTGGTPVHLIDNLMRDLNHGFRDTTLRFVREPNIVYIDDDVHYSDLPDLNVIFALYAQYYRDGVINWFLTPSIFQGQFVGYTSPGGPMSAGERGQTLINAAVGQPTNISTPPHEMGHVFFLWHPYETQFGVECTSGSNCSSAGDQVCDTAATPCLFNQNTTGTGIYFGNEVPPCIGDPEYNPNARLYMQCGWPAGHILRDQFSPGQLQRLDGFLNSISSDLLTQAPSFLVDCDGNGLDDIDEILAGDKVDLGEDMVPDVCQTLPQPGDLLVSGMNSGALNRPRYYDGSTGAYRGDMWNGLTWVHQMRFGAEGYVYLTRLSLVTRMDVRTGRNVDVLVDGVQQGAGTFVDLLFDDNRNLLVLDNVSSNIRRYTPSGQYVGVFANLLNAGMTSPKYMEYGRDGNIYVVGNGAQSNTVQGFDRNQGTPVGSLISPGAGGLVTGQGILFNGGFMYISNGAGNSVLRYTDSGAFVGTFVSPGSGGLNNPHSLRFGPDGHLYVASRGTHSVKRYHGTTGNYLGDFVTSGSGGPEGTGGLNQPAGLLFCSEAGPVVDLRLDREGDPSSGDARLSWSVPESDAPLLRFDTLRASSPNGFDNPECIEQEGADDSSIDLGLPAPGETRYFLIRSGNVCGHTPVATDSSGVARAVSSCP